MKYRGGRDLRRMAMRSCSLARLRSAEKWRRQRLTMSTLAFEEVAEGSDEVQKKKTAMFVHGLLGSGRNWRTFAKRLSEALDPVWRLVLVDLRNHGRSSEVQFPPPHDIPSAARDVAELIKAQPHLKPDVLIGHSMGGKVVLEFAKCSMGKRYGDEVSTPKQLWVLDSVIGEVPINDEGEVERVLSTIQTLPDPIPSRRWLVDQMLKLGFSKSLAYWLGSNLKNVSSTSEEATWIFNLKGAHDMFTSNRKMDYWSLLENPPQGTNIGIVRAIKSDRWTPETVSRLEELSGRSRTGSGSVSYQTLENAGHWLHVDNPDGLVKLLVPSFEKLTSH